MVLATPGCSGEQNGDQARVDARGTVYGGTPDQPQASSPAPALEGDLLEQPSGIGDLTLAQARKAVASNEAARRELIKRLLRATDADAPTLHRWLHRQVDTPVADMKNVLRATAAAVPDSKGRFTQPAQIKDLDWLEALLTLDTKKLSAPLRTALNECLLTVALIRATAAAAHPDASVSLVRFGYRHLGAFRDECGRQIRAMGVAAVPGLIRSRNLKDELGFKMVRYASYQLDRMNWTRPGRVLKMAGPDLQAELLHAYGEVRDTAAVNAVLAHTDATAEKVRRAARWATLRYVSGRPPRAMKRKLKLVGGRKTERARTLYYTYQQLASHALAARLAKALASQQGRPVEELKKELLAQVEPRHLAERLFAELDQKQERARASQLKEAVTLARAGKLEPALSSFDLILAAAPYHPGRAEMAPYYHQRGEDLFSKGKMRQAMIFFTKAIHLAPAGEFVNQARAKRLVAEAILTPQGSTARQTRLRQALVLIPNQRRATWELDQLNSRYRTRLAMAGGLGGAVALALVLGLTLVLNKRVRA